MKKSYKMELWDNIYIANNNNDGYSVLVQTKGQTVSSRDIQIQYFWSTDLILLVKTNHCHLLSTVIDVWLYWRCLVINQGWYPQSRLQDWQTPINTSSTSCYQPGFYGATSDEILAHENTTLPLHWNADVTNWLRHVSSMTNKRYIWDTGMEFDCVSFIKKIKS